LLSPQGVNKKLAVTVVVLVTVTVQGFVVKQPPPVKEENAEPAAGCAVTCTFVP
jgi:hypothetical protein